MRNGMNFQREQTEAKLGQNGSTQPNSLIGLTGSDMGIIYWVGLDQTGSGQIGSGRHVWPASLGRVNWVWVKADIIMMSSSSTSKNYRDRRFFSGKFEQTMIGS